VELITKLLPKLNFMKTILSLILALSYFTSYAQNEEKITIPKGIVYKYCDKKIVDKAKLLITENLSDSTKYDLCDKLLIVGPVLWNRFKNIEILNKIENGNTTFNVDKKQYTGKMTQDIADTKKVWKELIKEINGEKFIIRKLTEKELQYYWAVISFDIDEPLFVVETSTHKYILNLLKKNLKLMWLDEVPK
jgi:hypothetical protein